MSTTTPLPPNGYDLISLQPGVRILLPNPLIRQLRTERLQTEEQSLEQKHASLPMRSASASKPRPKRKRYGKEAKPGWYRVLPGIRNIEQELDGTRTRMGHSDKELGDRLREARQALVALGPDRRLVRSAQWRVALEELDAELPHFRSAVGAVRQALTLAEVTGRAVRIPPLLLLGPPGLGKTYFCHRLADVLSVPHGTLGFDQPSHGGQLRGSDSAWANTQTGLLFNMVALGDCANPLIVLDEVDKAHGSSSRREIDPLAQLHAALEPQTARNIEDVSVHVEFDASMVTYVATANSLHGIEAPLLTRFEVIDIEAPSPRDCLVLASGVVARTVNRLGLEGQVAFEPRALLVLAHMNPRLMVRAVEAALAQTVLERHERVSEEDLWQVLERRRGGAMAH